MRGHVRKRGNSWQALVKVVDPATGRARQISATRPTRKLADAALLELLVQAGRAGGIGSRATVEDLLNAWQALHADEWAASTIRNNRTLIDAYLIPTLGPREVAKLKPAELDLFYRDLRQTGGRARNGKRRPLSVGTVSKIHGVLRAALTQSVRWEWRADNPADRATLPRGERRRITPPSPADVIRLIDAAEQDDADFGAFLHLAAATGARRGELCALRWSDFDIEANTVTIARAISLGDEVVEKTTKTGNRRRIELDPDTVAIIRRHRGRARERVLACGTTLPDDAFVFTLDVDGSAPWRPDLPTHRFVKLRRRLGLDSIRLHDLRHFSVTELLAAGVDLSTVAGRHGHAGGGRTTLAVYAHLLEQADHGAAEVIGGVLRKGRAG